MPALHSTIGVSLVAFYGNKPPELIDLIQILQEYLANHNLIQNKFIPYQLEQVHGTIIGCEGLFTTSGIISKWFYERRQEIRSIDFVSLVDYLQRQIDFPLTIRFGGYNRSYDYNFLSRTQHPYVRSGQLQSTDSQTIPVLIGWSWDNGISLAIDSLRRNMQQFNLLHKYHATSDAVDNDFYLRLGTINGKLTAAQIDAIATDIRNLLEARSALYVSIKQENIAFAQYQDLLLTPETTEVISIAEATASKLKQIYFEAY